MGFWWSVLVRVIAGGVFLLAVHWASSSCSVGGREQSSTEVATATSRAPSSSALVPAPTWAEDETVEAGQVGQDAGRSGASGAPAAALMDTAPASTVTQSALTATATVVTAIDPLPATPVASAAPVETLAPASNNYAPWPVELWPMVGCLIHRESRGDPSVTGAQGERGLMQVGPANFAYLAERGISPASLYDGPTNIRAGWLLYLYWQDATGDGFYPWKSTRGGCA